MREQADKTNQEFQEEMKQALIDDIDLLGNLLQHATAAKAERAQLRIHIEELSQE